MSILERSILVRSGKALGVTVALGLGLSATPAWASGFSTARFGGEHGHATTDNPTALYYNPAALTNAKGTRLFVEGALVVRLASYERPEGLSTNNALSEDLAPGANSGTARLRNVLGSPMAAVSSDFGTKFMVGALGLYFPFGGQSTWGRNNAYADSADFPGAVNGPQRWHTIDGTLRAMYITGSLAFKIEKIGLSIGLSGSAVKTATDTIRARNADGSDDLVTLGADGERFLKEGRSWIQAEGWQGTFGVGLMWQWKEQFWAGLSYNAQPNVVGGMKLTGTLTNLLAVAPQSETPIDFYQTLPDIMRLGLRYRAPSKKWEVRVNADYQRWSVMKTQCVVQRGGSCDFPDVGDPLDPEVAPNYGLDPDPTDPTDGVDGVILNIPRFWRDGGGVRVGGSYWFIPKLETLLSVGYDSTVVPNQTIEPALMDMHKVLVTGGIRYQFIEQLALSVQFTQVIYAPVDTGAKDGVEGDSLLDDFGTSPTAVGDNKTVSPTGDGIYRQAISLVNIYLDVKFGRNGKKKKKGSVGGAASPTGVEPRPTTEPAPMPEPEPVTEPAPSPETAAPAPNDEDQTSTTPPAGGTEPATEGPAAGPSLALR